MSVPARGRYQFLAHRAGFQSLAVPVIAPDAGGRLDLRWLSIPLPPWHSGALLPLLRRGE